MGAIDNNVTATATPTAPGSDPSVDPNGNPFHMPDHTTGEAFITWAILAVVVGLLVGVLLLDFCQKQRGHEMTTKRFLRKGWNWTLGRIDCLRVEHDDLYSGLEKGKSKAKTCNDSSSDDGSSQQPSNNPTITVTQTVTQSGSAQGHNPNPSINARLPVLRVSDDRPGSGWGPMLEHNTPVVGTGGHSEGRRGSQASNLSQHNGERAVAQPIPGQMLTGSHI